MKHPLIYIAGKVTGEPYRETVIKFETAHNQVKGIGFDAISPVEVVQDFLSENPEAINLTESELWQLAMKLCITEMLNCDAVLLLDDWTQSKGAIIECQLALDLGIPRFTTIDEIVKHYEAKKTTDHIHN